MRATAIAPPNIALVKYWGKRDVALNLPAAGSLSVTLAGLQTTTHVSFEEELDADVVVLDGREGGPAGDRVARFLDLVRAAHGPAPFARVETGNDFPTGAGLASSASGFAALALAVDAALGLGLSPSALSALARRGSGSAARSVISGYAEMRPGEAADGSDAFAVPVAPADALPMVLRIAITETGPKAVGSTEGMERSRRTSPYHRAFCSQARADVAAMREALAAKDLAAVGALAESSALRMHADMWASQPPLVYWNGATVEVLRAIAAARDEGLRAWCTIDAGPQVKVLCHERHADDVSALLAGVAGVADVLSARPGPGGHVVGHER